MHDSLFTYTRCHIFPIALAWLCAAKVGSQCIGSCLFASNLEARTIWKMLAVLISSSGFIIERLNRLGFEQEATYWKRKRLCLAVPSLTSVPWLGAVETAVFFYQVTKISVQRKGIYGGSFNGANWAYTVYVQQKFCPTSSVLKIYLMCW